MEPEQLQVMLEDAGVKVTRTSSDEVYAHCPQPDRHPNGDARASWSINAETGAHYCFSCGYRGTLRSLLKDLTGHVPEDLDKTIKIASIKRHAARVLQRGTEAAEPEEEIFISEYQFELYGQVPLWACEARNLDPVSVDMYGVRWDRQNDWWVIPVRDRDGRLLGWQLKGKRYFNNVPAGMEKSKSLFGLDVFRGGIAIVVESPLDVVRMHTAGIEGGLATYGALISDEQINILRDVASPIVLALDHDEAGRRSMVNILDQHRKTAHFKIVRYRSDDPKDIGEMRDAQILRLIYGAVTPGLQRRYVHS